MVFHTEDSYSTTPAAISRNHTFLYGDALDPYNRGFRLTCQSHSNHRHFIDPRPVGGIPHLWGTFVCGVPPVHLRPLSADFTELLTQAVSSQRQSEYQGRRFRALPHHSTYRIISSPNNTTIAFHYWCLVLIPYGRFSCGHQVLPGGMEFV